MKNVKFNYFFVSGIASWILEIKAKNVSSIYTINKLQFWIWLHWERLWIILLRHGNSLHKYPILHPSTGSHPKCCTFYVEYPLRRFQSRQPLASDLPLTLTRVYFRHDLRRRSPSVQPLLFPLATSIHDLCEIKNKKGMNEMSAKKFVFGFFKSSNGFHSLFNQRFQ